MARIITDKKTGNTVLIRYANAGFVVEKTLASGLADAFSQHIPAWKPSANQCFQKDFWAKQGHLRSRMSDVFSQSRASSLAKGCGSTAPAWLVQAQPCASLPIRVNPFHPWFPKFCCQ
jgi:hypothetical protein